MIPNKPNPGDKMMIREALIAISKWKFKPSKINNKKVRAKITVPISYRFKGAEKK
jgi:outer membrane biosynthesis protein TonB